MYRVGDWVEVRSKEEILRTLDQNGRLGGMPFMPEMFKFCGQRFSIYKSAHKTCDPVYEYKSRRLDNAFHLQTRCDGSAHGNCQHSCLIFWRSEWIKGVDVQSDRSPANAGSLTCADVEKAASSVSGGEIRYSCQSTSVLDFSKNTDWWEPTQYVKDYFSGNVSLGSMIHGALYVGLVRRWCFHLPVIGRIYDKIAAALGQAKLHGYIPGGASSSQPLAPSELKPGTLVRVKSAEEIYRTLDARRRHKGLAFDVELLPYCGRVFKVRQQIDKIIDEQTGALRSLKTPAFTLEEVWCRSKYSSCRLHCPRSIYSWWRAEWLEKP